MASGDLGCLTALDRLGAIGSRPRVLNAMNDRQGREYGDDPQHRRHAVEERTDDDQHQTFGPFHESHAAGTNQRLGPRTAVTDHDRADDYVSGQNNVEEASSACVEDQQSEELRCIAVAVNHRVEKCAESGHALLCSRDFAIYKVEEAGCDDDQSGIKEHALLVLGRSIAKEESSPGIDHQSHERKHVGIDLGKGKPADNCPQQNRTGSSEGACPGHGKSGDRMIGSSGDLKSKCDTEFSDDPITLAR